MKRFMVVAMFGAVVLLIASACGGADPTATPRPAAPTPTSAGATATIAATATRPAPTATTAAATPAAATSTPTRPAATATRPAATATPAPAVAPTPAAGAPKRGGVVKQGDRPTASKSYQPTLTNPRFGPANANQALLMYQSLFQFNTYKNNALDVVLAAKSQYNDAADQITVTLDPAARWSDGKPVTANDVKFTLDSWITPPAGFTATPTARVVAQAIGSVTAVDALTVRLQLKTPDVSLLSLLAVPQAVMYPAHRSVEDSVVNPIGSGPYQFKEVQNDVKATFVRNQGYWMKDAQGGSLPYLDGVENIIVPDENTAFAAILTGGIDVLNSSWSLGPKADEIAKKMPKAAPQTRLGGNLGWGFNPVRPFDNPQVVKAMSILTDRLSLVELGYGGGGVIDAVGVLPAMSKSEWSLPMKEILSYPGYRYINSKTKELETDSLRLLEGKTAVYEKDPKDIEAAKAMLKQAGFDPFPSFTLSAASAIGYDNMATVIAQSFKKYLGVDIKLDIVDLATHNDRMAKANFTAVVNSTYSSSADPSPMLRFFTTGNAYWKHNFAPSNFDDLFKRQNAQTDPAKRREVVWQFQRAVQEGVHIVPAFQFYSVSGVVREWVKNWPMPVLSTSYTWSQDRVWIDRS